MEMLVLLALLGGGILVYRHVSADGAGPDLAWRGRSAAGVATGSGFAPYRSEGAASTLSVAARLSYIETRRFLASPLIWVGLALVGRTCLMVLDTGIPDQSEWLSLSGRFTPMLIYPLCGMVLIAANRAALRPRRDGTVELLDSLPARPATRTLSLVLALRGPVLVGVVATAALTVSIWLGAGKSADAPLWSRSELRLPFGDIGTANIIGAIVLVACAGALGIVLARVLPWGLVPIVALVVVAISTGRLGADDLSPVVSGLSPIANGADLPAFLSPVAQGWHVVYLVGLGTIAVGAAFLLDGERRWGTAVLAVAAVLVATSVVAQSRTYAGDTADQLADLVTEPAAHQRCIGDDSVTVCHFPELDEIAAGWLALAGPVRDAAPADVLDGPLEIHTRLSAEEIGQLGTPVRAELERRGDSFPWIDEAGMHPDLRWGDGERDALRALLVGHELVGLPETGAPPVAPCYAGGQARAAVAVALAGRGLDAGGRHELRSPIAGGGADHGDDRPYGDPSLTTLSEADWEVDSEPAVVHTESDLALGRVLLERPVDEVRGGDGRGLHRRRAATQEAAAPHLLRVERAAVRGRHRRTPRSPAPAPGGGLPQGRHDLPGRCRPGDRARRP